MPVTRIKRVWDFAPRVFAPARLNPPTFRRHTLRIAQVAPLYESVPPHKYGGTERVVSYITEELVKMGHDVTLFASGDSKTAAKLIPACAEALRLSKSTLDPFVYQTLQLEQVAQNIDWFDIVHFHSDYFHFPLSRRMKYPQLTTLHGRLDLPDLVHLYRTYSDMPLVSISQAQRKPIRFARWIGNVYHGLPLNLFRANINPGSYLTFVGRISPEKRVDRAIRIAEQSGIPIKIAAKVDKVDVAYFNEVIKPMLSSRYVEFVGEVSQGEKQELLGGAIALVFPIDWPEPFGLAMIESMACGTPAIAYRMGSVPEVIDEGVSGFIIDSEEDGAAAVERCAALDRAVCRRQFELRFSSARMAAEYVELYSSVAQRKGRAALQGSP